MADLIVGAGAILPIDAAYTQLPKYDLFRMEANSSILADVDLVIKPRRAEFGPNCGIMARGTAGPGGQNGPLGGTAGNGAPGRNGHNVTIEAGLAQIGGLTIVTDGGAGGGGGNGAQGLYDPFGAYGPGGGAGNGGNGGKGGDAGQIVVRSRCGLCHLRSRAPRAFAFCPRERNCAAHSAAAKTDVFM